MLFNEPKLLKFAVVAGLEQAGDGFSALQRAEIAEILIDLPTIVDRKRFSALQRAEIAEIIHHYRKPCGVGNVSVLFNEPKLLKSDVRAIDR